MDSLKLVSPEILRFTSDLHFFHKSTITRHWRPHNSLEEMHEQLIENWNKDIDPKALTIVIGDFSLGSEEETDSVLRRLKGRMILVPGNHDHSDMIKRVYHKYFEKISMLLNIKVLRSVHPEMVCCHYPMLTWAKAHYGAWMLHGHSHGSMKYPFEGKIMDVGVDVHDFAPVSYQTVSEFMMAQPIHVIDNHKPRTPA